MIITTPWLKQVHLFTAMANGAFVTVAVMLQTSTTMVVAFYTPHLLLKQPELAQAFWSGCTTVFKGLSQLLMLEMDTNYHVLSSQHLLF